MEHGIAHYQLLNPDRTVIDILEHLCTSKTEKELIEFISLYNYKVLVHCNSISPLIESKKLIKK